MKAMILAAGRGERMRPLTDTMPKALLPLRGKPLIVHQLEKLAAAGLREVVINTGWRGEQIPARLGDGSAWGLGIAYSHEGWPALDTGGGLKRALPLLGEGPFLVVNADVYTDYPFADLLTGSLPAQDLAHLVLTVNPVHHHQGDFALIGDRAAYQGVPRYTYTGIGLYRPELVREIPGDAFPLTPLLQAAMQTSRVGAELYTGGWWDVGTPERLKLLESSLA